jgi:hypothetical protein
MDSPLEQAINDHLELQKRNAVLRRGPALAHGWNASADEEDEVPALEGAGTEQRQEHGDDLWSAVRDFEWGEYRERSWHGRGLASPSARAELRLQGL